MRDPRAKSNVKLVPPFPLPHVSRKALARVKDTAPIPEKCRYCDGEVKLINNREVYGREFGDWPYCYRCAGCGAKVGLHPNTDLPLGIIANRALTDARKANKAVFHAMQQRFDMSRNFAYGWLARKLGIPKSQCHWGWFDEAQCQAAGEVCRQALNDNTIG